MCGFPASGSRRRLPQSLQPLHVTPSASSENSLGVIRLIANLPFYRRFLRPPSRVALGAPHCVHAVANSPACRMELVGASLSTHVALPKDWALWAPAFAVAVRCEHL